MEDGLEACLAVTLEFDDAAVVVAAHGQDVAVSFRPSGGGRFGTWLSRLRERGA